MTDSERHHYEMLVRVKQFGLDHEDVFPADSLGGRTFAALAAAADHAGGYLTSQAQGRGAARSGTLSKEAARAALRHLLKTLARTARAMAADGAGLEGRFALPPGMNDLELVAAGRAFALEAAPLAPQFIAHGLPTAFLADLQSALDAFENAAQERVTGRAVRASAGVGIRTALDAAFDELARLDAIVPNTLREHPTILAVWKLARRVPRPAAAAPGQTASAAPGSAQPAEPAAAGATAGAKV